MLTLTGLQRYYEILASQEKEAPIKEKRKERGRLYRSKKKEKTLFTETPESGSFVKGEKKGKGFLRLLEAYSKHVEGLQMVQ